MLKMKKEVTSKLFLSEKYKDFVRKYSKDSLMYESIGHKCVFCRETITKNDVKWPRNTYKSPNGMYAHDNCVMYVADKYPYTPLSTLEGKINRIAVELSVYGQKDRIF